MIAKLPPDTSAAGHTSIACFNVPPSILTNSATSQNGTSSETHGSWWPAMVDSVSSSSWLTAASVTIGVPIAPVAFGAIGTPIVTLAAVSQLDELTLSTMAGHQLPWVSLLVPFWLVALFVKMEGGTLKQ